MIKCLARVAAVAAGMLVTSVTASSAQTFWDWGGSQTVGGTGKEIIRFNASFKPGQIIASFSDRRLYFIVKPGEAISYPIAIPREQSRWQGVMTVSQKRENPSWTPTPEMRRENPRLPSWVPGGHPMNPMGVRALYLGSSAYRIHGTDAPWTIGQPVSKGCIRMFNQDVIDLYNRVPVGAQVTVTWQSYRADSEGAQVASARSQSAPARVHPASAGFRHERSIKMHQSRTRTVTVE